MAAFNALDSIAGASLTQAVGEHVAVENWNGIDDAAASPLAAMESLFTSPRWIGALAATYGFAAKASTLEVDGKVTAAIPYCEIEDLRGRRIVSLPFSDYADPLVASAATWHRLATPILDHDVPVRFRCLRNELPRGDARLETTVQAAWHGADLTRSEADLWTGLDASARQNIRHAEAAGVSVRVGRTLDDVRTFYSMHARVRKTKYRLFAQPISFFENLHHAFAPDDLFVLLAELDGRAVAGILFLIHRNTFYYKFNASIALATRPNDLLVWRGLLLGRELGLSQLDFGISDLDQPGLVRFKRKFATEERPVLELRRPPNGIGDVRVRQANDALRRLTEILTAPDVPDEATRAAGDELYRYFC